MLEGLNENMIQLDVEAADFNDAIEKAAKPLKDAGMITDHYVEEIIAGVKQYGPYIVLAPHIALAHAAPEAGAKETGVAIASLKEPVVSGNEANDPVKYIIAMSAISGEKHMELISELSELLSDQAFYELLETSADPNEIAVYLRENY